MERKRIRIKEFDYIGNFAYFITICTYNKQIYFNNETVINNTIISLKREADRFSFSIYAYCFMPDHLHLLLTGEEGVNLIKFMRAFKQITGYYFKQHLGKPLWQRSFFDHVIRKREAINNLAGYIFNNPVRKGLVDDFRKYPYLGSFVFDIRDFYSQFSQLKNINLDFMPNK
jgi:putative transposase